MKITISPEIALCDQKVNIVVSGLPPSGNVKIAASMCLPWAKDIRFASAAWFTADANGLVDLTKQKSDSGSYDSVDGMGLITSMKADSDKALGKLCRNMSIDNNQFIDFVAQCGQDQARVTVERQLLAEGINRRMISEAFIGELFYTENPGNKTVVFLGGSASSLAINAPIASVLASHGFNVLSLPYFGEKGLPAKLSEIPLEYFEKAFAWLTKNPITSGKELYVLGMSKGAELALILATRFSCITRIALWAPHAYCFQGIAFKNASSWTREGKPLPYIRVKNGWLFSNIIGCIMKNEVFGYTHTYRKALDRAKNKEAARINVEDMHADLLMFTGKQNNIWNSYDGCVQIMETLRKKNYRHTYDMVTYENAGETFFVPYLIPYGDAAVKMAPRLMFSLGGTSKGNAHLQADSWEKTIEFFKK